MSVVADWAQHQLAVDPRFDVRVSGDAYRQGGALLVPVNDSLSLSASEGAKAAGISPSWSRAACGPQDDPQRLSDAQGQALFTKLTTWAGTLPADQRCPGTASGA
ncbi:MAG: hypothetical protein R2731_06445 [Nocardioides sp.]